MAMISYGDGLLWRWSLMATTLHEAGTELSGARCAPLQATKNLPLPFQSVQVSTDVYSANGHRLQCRWTLSTMSVDRNVSSSTNSRQAPESTLIGPGGGMEAGRAANLVKVLGGAVTLKLSSSAVEDPLNGAARPPPDPPPVEDK
eukprot:601009-Prorocentrum_minimum.AAC.1